MPLTDDLQLVPNSAKSARGAVAVTFRCHRDRVEMTLTSRALAAAGWAYGQYIQLFVSRHAIQIRQCKETDPEAKRINRNNVVVVNALRELWKMPEGDRLQVPVEPMGDKGKTSLLGTIPAAYRETLRQRRVIREVA